MSRDISAQRLTAEQIEAQVAMVVSGGSEALSALQGAIWAMIGPEGPQLARLATRQPAQFYIDDRVYGLAYPRLAIEQAVDIYRRACLVLNIEPADVNGVERLPHLGLF